MLKIGAHMGISKGFAKVPEDTLNIGGNAFQIFVQSPRLWKSSVPKDKDIQDFKNNLVKLNINPEDNLVHSSYLINLASPNDENREKSINSFIEQMKITKMLGLKYFNVHPGSHLGSGESEGIDRIAKAIDQIYASADLNDVWILLENTAKKGDTLGYSIKQLGQIINLSSNKERIGITYDTCHGFDSNYDIRTKDGVNMLLDEIDKYLGIEKFKMIHLNDSKFDLGAGKDRHEFIGKGTIGIEGFKNFFSFEIIRNIPLLLETPGDDAEHKTDIDLVKSIY